MVDSKTDLFWRDLTMSDERCPKCAELYAQIDDLERVEAKLREENYKLKESLARIEKIAQKR